ncbi:MAG: hypothetical protein ACI8Q1_001662, partial [Parvicella sp.]
MQTNLGKIFVRMSKIFIYGIIIHLSIFTLAFTMDSNAQRMSVEEIKVELPFNNAVSLN